MTAICSIGGVVLDNGLYCPELWQPDTVQDEVLYVGGGKAVIFSPALRNLTLQARFENNKLNAVFTIAQKEALLALPDYAHEFQHPLATRRGIVGITVIVDKASVADLTQYGPEIVNPSATTRYSDGNLLWFYGIINLFRMS